MTDPVSRDDVAEAARRIEGHVRRTPVVETGAGTFGLDASITLKLEQLQHSGSFKARGAFNTLLSDKVPQAGVAAASGGNHGAAVAHAARALGHRADIFVPETSSPAKIARIRSYGATLHVGGARYADAAEACARHRETSGAMDIHAYDAPGTIAGQGTVALEWLEQSPDLDTVLIAVGGGGLISGCALWLAGKVKVVAVEPEGSWARCTRRSPPASRSTSRSTVSLPTVSGRNVAAIWCTGSARPACPKACSSPTMRSWRPRPVSGARCRSPPSPVAPPHWPPSWEAPTARLRASGSACSCAAETSIRRHLPATGREPRLPSADQAISRIGEPHAPCRQSVQQIMKPSEETRP